MWYLLLSVCCKILSFLAITYHWIFPICPCTRMDRHLSTTSNKIVWGLHLRICGCFEIYWLNIPQTFLVNFVAVCTLEWLYVLLCSLCLRSNLQFRHLSFWSASENFPARLDSELGINVIIQWTVMWICYIVVTYTYFESCLYFFYFCKHF